MYRLKINGAIANHLSKKWHREAGLGAGRARVRFGDIGCRCRRCFVGVDGGFSDCLNSGSRCATASQTPGRGAQKLTPKKSFLCQETQGRSSRKVLEILSTRGALTLPAGLHPTGNAGRAVHVPTVCGSQVHLLLQKCQAYCTLILVLSFFTHGNCDRFGIHDC